MARIKDGLISGKLGDVVLKVCRNTQVVSARPAKYTPRRTEKSVTQQCKMSNGIALWRVLKPHIGGLLGNREENLTNYNRFLRLYLQSTPVYLQREEARMHTAVVNDCIVSTGPLKSMDWTHGHSKWLSNIMAQSLQPATMPDGTITLHNWCQHNADWKQNDLLRIIVLKQFHSTENELPAYVKAWAKDVEITHLTTLPSLPHGLEWALETVLPKDAVVNLSIKVPEKFQGGFATIHLRQTPNGIIASQQHVVCLGKICRIYCNEQSREKAVASYLLRG